MSSIKIQNEINTTFLLGSYNPISLCVEICISMELLKALEGQAFLITSIKLPDEKHHPMLPKYPLNTKDENSPLACVIKFRRIEVNNEDTRT